MKAKKTLNSSFYQPKTTSKQSCEEKVLPDKIPSTVAYPSGFRHINRFVCECVQSIQDAHDRHEPDITGLSSGFEELDRLTGGLHPGELTLITGCSSAGKTALALNIASNIAIDHSLPVGVFSLGMRGTDVAMRVLMALGCLDCQRISTGDLSDDEWSRLSVALGKLHEAPFFIDENDGITANDLCSRARQLHRQCEKFGLIVIDHLQMIRQDTAGESNSGNATKPLMAFKALAKELDVPIIVISSPFLGIEDHWNKRPLILDLPEYDFNEEDADVVVFMSLEDIYDQVNKQVQSTANCFVGKQFLGLEGTVQLRFLKESLMFESLDCSQIEQLGSAVVAKNRLH